MAELLFKQGGFRILADDVGKLSVAEMNQLIKTAGTTSHQTRERSKKTPEEFIKMLWEIKHYSVLEHSWFVFQVIPREAWLNQKELGFEILKANGLFQVTPRKDGSLLVSGNARIWNEGFIKAHKDNLVPAIMFLFLVSRELQHENQVLFPIDLSQDEKIRYNLRNLELKRNPEFANLEEILTHRAMTVEFNNHSRGMTHENVRSRNGDEKITSYTQESTRYVDYSKGDVNLDEFQIKFVLPYNNEFDFTQWIDVTADGIDYRFTPQQFTNLIEAWYRALRKKGLRPEEARQWLPIGIKSQIVQTYNLREWRHWFYIRANAPAHPEIRWSAVNLLKEVQQRIPGIFDDFEFKTKDDGSEYAVYTGDDSLI